MGHLEKRTNPLCPEHDSPVSAVFSQLQKQAFGRIYERQGDMLKGSNINRHAFSVLQRYNGANPDSRTALQRHLSSTASYHSSPSLCCSSSTNTRTPPFPHASINALPELVGCENATSPSVGSHYAGDSAKDLNSTAGTHCISVDGLFACDVQENFTNSMTPVFWHGEDSMDTNLA
jgi:hypothetical protein